MPGQKQSTSERVTEAVLSLSVCHNVTPVYDTDGAEGSLPQAEQVINKLTNLLHWGNNINYYRDIFKKN